MNQIFRTILLFVTCFLAVACFQLSAQEEEKYAIQIIACPQGDSIMLRWAPVNTESWYRGNKYGYTVERYLITKNTMQADGAGKLILNKTPITPWPLEKWTALAKKDNYAAVVAEAIYGESFLVESTNESAAVSIFNQASEQENRFSFALFAADHSPNAARASGLWYCDRKVKKGEKYLYLVYFAGNDTRPMDTGYVATGLDEYVPLAKPKIITSFTKKNTAMIEWIGPEGRSAFTSYMVERSDDTGKTFSVRNTSPLINLYDDPDEKDRKYYIDTLPGFAIPYIYRIRGISPFGEKGPYSDTVIVTAKEEIEDVPMIVKKETSPEGVLLEWKINRLSDKKIDHFQLLRSPVHNTGFLPVSGNIGPEERKFIDANPINTAYYKIMAYGKQGDIVSSYPVLVQLVDSVPPAIPSGLKYIADTTGKVVLNWSANKEEDMYGYRIFRANSKDEEFSQLTSDAVPDTFYVDRINLKTLSKKVYYKITAIDQRQNRSLFSEILEVDRPDVVPPSAPVFRRISSASKGVYIEWINSTSSDLVSQYILRKKEDTKNWERIYSFNTPDTSYCDSLAETGILYNYTLVAYDKSGLQSEFSQVMTGKKLSAVRDIVLKAKAVRSRNAILLTWEAGAEETDFIIYKGIDNAQPATYVHVKNGTGNYEDTRVSPDTKYKYIVKVTGNGNTAFSNEVEIRY